MVLSSEGPLSDGERKAPIERACKKRREVSLLTVPIQAGEPAATNPWSLFEIACM